jgi:hypothetical protein
MSLVRFDIKPASDALEAYAPFDLGFAMIDYLNNLADQAEGKVERTAHVHELAYAKSFAEHFVQYLIAKQLPTKDAPPYWTTLPPRVQSDLLKKAVEEIQDDLHHHARLSLDAMTKDEIDELLNIDLDDLDEDEVSDLIDTDGDEDIISDDGEEQ